MEVSLGTAALPDPTRRQMIFALIAAAIAHPTACGNCVAKLPEMEKILPALEWYITGSWRPLHMSRVLESS